MVEGPLVFRIPITRLSIECCNECIRFRLIMSRVYWLRELNSMVDLFIAELLHIKP